MKKKMIRDAICYGNTTKTWKVMRLSVFSLFLIIAQVWAEDGYSQQTQLSFQMEDVKISEVLDKIEESSEFYFLLNQKLINVERIVDISVNELTIKEVLDDLFIGTDVQYLVKDRQIILTTDKERFTTAQEEKTISGSVTDDTGDPLPGVSVVIKGTTSGTITDVDGNYSLSGITDGTTLVFSFIGMKTQEISVGNKMDINVMLISDAIGLDEIVAIGYGSTKKGDLTGAVASVKGDELSTIGNTTLAQTFKGQVAGLKVTQTSSQPGAGVLLQIRGAAANASPLIIVDGVPMSTMWQPEEKSGFKTGSHENVLSHINPDDIEDMTILKDASATAIYGSRAAGGVILITTKRGNKGEDRVNVSLNSSVTAQVIAEQPEVMNAKDYMLESNKSQLERWVRGQGYSPWGSKSLPDNKTLISEYEQAHNGMSNNGWNYNPEGIKHFVGGTDWQDEVSRMGVINQHNLSINGGSKKSAYLFSLGYMDNQGVLEKNNYNRITGRLNFDIEFNKYIKAGISSGYTVTNSDDAALDGNHGFHSIYSTARGYDPVIPTHNINGKLNRSELKPATANPLEYLQFTFQSRRRSLLASGFLDIKPITDLSIKTTVGYDYKTIGRNSYIPASTTAGEALEGEAQIIDNEVNNYYINSTATYTKTIDNHNFNVVAGWEYRTDEATGITAQNSGFPYDAVQWHNLQLGTYERPGVGSHKYTSEAMSLIGRFNYSYKSKYFITANFRRDGSSNFTENKQYGNFGGVSAAYRISEEPFMKNFSWLSNLKLRAGAGITGNEGSLTGINTYYAAGKDYYFNNTLQPGIALEKLGNPNLSWESQTDINLGLDLGFFNNKIGATIDIYERTINDRIGEKSLMSYHQVNKIDYNTKRIDKTKGLEVSAYANFFQESDFKWTTQGTFTYYQDFTTKRDPSEVYKVYESESYDWNNEWYYLSDGLVQAGEEVPHMNNALPGMIKIKDVNGYVRDNYGEIVYVDGRAQRTGNPDGTIDDADKVNVGNNTPVQIGWVNQFKYKNWDLSINAYGSFNNYKHNGLYAGIDHSAPIEGHNTIVTFMDRYTFDNTDAYVPGYTQAESNYGWGDYFLQHYWYLRLENITLGYTLPLKSKNKIGLSSLRLYASANNIAVLTNYDGYDPEYDVYLYPSVTSYTFGLDIKF